MESAELELLSVGSATRGKIAERRPHSVPHAGGRSRARRLTRTRGSIFDRWNRVALLSLRPKQDSADKEGSEMATQQVCCIHVAAASLTSLTRHRTDTPTP